MRRFIIEGSCDGGLFAETIDANTIEDAEAFAIERLCEAWGEDFGPDTTLDDLGDSASVREYDEADYIRDAADDMLSFIDQIARMHTTEEMRGTDDTGNDAAMDSLVIRARALAATARGEG